MIWASEGVESRLQITHTQDGRTFSESRKFNRGSPNSEGSSDSELAVLLRADDLHADDREVSAKPYLLETLKLTLNEDYDGHGTLKELVVRIRDGTALVYIERKFDYPLLDIDSRMKFGDTKYLDEFFFDKDMLLGVRPSYHLYPSLLCYKPPVVDEKTMPHFDELKAARPGAARSIDVCLKEFAIPGSQYATTSGAKSALLPLVTGSQFFRDNQR